MVKLQLEAVAVRCVIVGDGAQAGVALRADAHLIEHGAVDLHVALVVGFCCGVFQHVVPVRLVHLDVHAEDAAGVKQRRFIFLRNALVPGPGRERTGKGDGAETQADGSGHDRRNDLRDVFVRKHGSAPRYDRYSPL